MRLYSPGLALALASLLPADLFLKGTDKSLVGAPTLLVLGRSTRSDAFE